MDGPFLKRLGSYVALVAIAALLFIADSLDPSELRLARLGAIGGIVLVGLGFLWDLGSRKSCSRCGRRAIAGSVFCATHRRDLQSVASAAAHRQRSDGRGE